MSPLNNRKVMFVNKYPCVCLKVNSFSSSWWTALFVLCQDYSQILIILNKLGNTARAKINRHPINCSHYEMRMVCTYLIYIVPAIRYILSELVDKLLVDNILVDTAYFVDLKCCRTGCRLVRDLSTYLIRTIWWNI